MTMYEDDLFNYLYIQASPDGKDTVIFLFPVVYSTVLYSAMYSNEQYLKNARTLICTSQWVHWKANECRWSQVNTDVWNESIWDELSSVFLIVPDWIA